MKNQKISQEKHTNPQREEQIQEQTPNVKIKNKNKHKKQSTKNKLKKTHLQMISSRSDDHRHHLAHQNGGITCDDPLQIDKLRSVGKQVIKLIGRKILNGQFNLTKISIPIKSCYPKTALFNVIKGYKILPYFMKYASVCPDPVQRFKIVTACLLAQPYYLNMFLKPLNPILGETLQAKLTDGTEIYAEQISHHPPISYYLIIGPNESYRFSGYYDIEVSPSLNSLTIKNLGKRKFQFKDGTVITSTYAANQFSSTFFGTSRVQETGMFTIQDLTNGLFCKVEMGKIKKKPTDYFQSFIVQKKQNQQKSICKVNGTYLGYIQFDGKRFWDGRDLNVDQIVFQDKKSRLLSDWQYREDIIQLLNEDLQKGQQMKQMLEQVQRNDRKLRKKYCNENVKQ